MFGDSLCIETNNKNVRNSLISCLYFTGYIYFKLNFSNKNKIYYYYIYEVLCGETLSMRMF